LTTTLNSQTQGIQNANNAASYLQTADSYLNQVQNNLQRMRQLAVESNNGGLSTTDQANLDKEYQQLATANKNVEVNANYNGAKLFDGSVTSTTFQYGQSSATAAVKRGSSRRRAAHSSACRRWYTSSRSIFAASPETAESACRAQCRDADPVGLLVQPAARDCVRAIEQTQLDERRAPVLVERAVERERVRVPGFGAGDQQLVHRARVADLVLRDRRERDVFLQQRRDAGPFRVAPAEDQLVVSDLQQQLLFLLVHVPPSISL